MSRPRYDWWSYVKGMIRRYPALKSELQQLQGQSVTPNYSGVSVKSGTSRSTELTAIRELPTTNQREYEAVRRAIEATERMTASRDRLRVIDLVFWKQSQDLEHAALIIPCSYRTARRYHSDFIKLVAAMYGLLDL